MNLKKISIIFTNLVIIFFILFLADYIVYKKNLAENEIETNFNYLSSYKNDYYEYTYSGIENRLKKKDFQFRHLNNNVSTQNQKNGDILLFGCSYTYGSGLKDNETLNYKLSKLTGRKVYNFGIESAGAQHMLHLLKNDDFIETYLNQSNPKYVIYTYIPNHLSRLYNNLFPGPLYPVGFNLRYELKKDKLKNVSIPRFLSFLSRSYLVKNFIFKIDNMNYSKNKKYKLFKDFNEILLESKEILQEKYPNIKFVVLKIGFNDEFDEDTQMPFMRKVLESEGFIFLDSKDIIGRKFDYESDDTVDDNIHPSSKAWDMLLPKIVKKLNL